MSTQTETEPTEVVTATETKPGQLFVSYGHLNRNKLPLKCHVTGDWIPVEAIDLQAHADVAPPEAEWFQYYVRSEGDTGYTPVDHTYYLIDATLGEDWASRHIWIGCRAMRLRHTPEVVWGYYSDEGAQRAMVSTSRS